MNEGVASVDTVTGDGVRCNMILYCYQHLHSGGMVRCCHGTMFSTSFKNTSNFNASNKLYVNTEFLKIFINNNKHNCHF